MIERLSLRQRFVLFFVALYMAGLLATVAGLWLGYSRSGGAPDGYVIAGVIIAVVLLGVTTWIAMLFDENVAKPILAVAADLNTRAQTEIEVGIDDEQARYLGALAPSANAINDAIIALRARQTEAIAEETKRIGRDRALFEALLRDLAEGVVVANPEHRIMLYNRVAQDLLGNLGLDRELSSCMQAQSLEQALDRLNTKLATDPAAVETFLASTVDGERFLQGRVGAVIWENTRIGHVIIFHDATDDLAAYREHDHLFNTLLEGTRRPVAAISAALDVLQTDAEMPAEVRMTFTTSMQEEVDRLIPRLKDVGARHDAAVTRHWPMSELSSSDLFLALKARNIARIEIKGDVRFVSCDAFAILELLSRVTRELASDDTRSGFTAWAETKGDEVHLCLGWTGTAVSDGQLDRWLEEPLSPVYGNYSGRDALATHKTELWCEQAGTGHRIVLPVAAASAPVLRSTDERPEFYDFDLPLYGSGGELDDRPLSELRFVVFDTETTGLSPRGGDEIVQIAGVRVVNGRVLRGEVFDTLVNPKRPIPSASTAVHGIDDSMVVDAPDIEEAGQAFHDFCEGSVLVAHNAPFDMAFLKLKQGEIGQRFDHPVLCTVLLSAVMFDHSNLHTLDALVDRFGVELPAEVRHTAIGDAMATAEVFRQMLELMRKSGITTLREATDAARQITHITKAQDY